MPYRNETTRARLLRAGWILLAAAALAIAVPVLATAARPHVLWLFTMSYASVALVVGTTLVRVARAGEALAMGPRRRVQQLFTP
jgi:hypothetical protein